MTSRTLNVVVRRRYRASRELVFRALTEADSLTRWFSPSEDIATEVLELELRAGGTYRFGFRFPDGSENYVVGEFREITRPTRLVFTWTWEEPDPHAGIETLVTIELVGHGEATEVVVTHGRFPTMETRDRHDEGWNGAFDRLEKLLVQKGKQ